VLTAARVSMAFQFQSFASAAPHSSAISASVTPMSVS
jgi:hypothetical protein